MNPTLQQLKDIHLPHAICMWPIAPGWIILYFAALGLLIYLLYYYYRKRKQRYIVNYALRQLNQLKELKQNNNNPQNINIAAELSTLIRRTALYYFNRNVIAGLSGQNWLQFLNESGRTTQFTADAGQLLIEAPYRKNQDADLTTLFTLTENWLLAIACVNRERN